MSINVANGSPSASRSSDLRHVCGNEGGLLSKSLTRSQSQDLQILSSGAAIFAIAQFTFADEMSCDQGRSVVDPLRLAFSYTILRKESGRKIASRNSQRDPGSLAYHEPRYRIEVARQLEGGE